MQIYISQWTVKLMVDHRFLASRPSITSRSFSCARRIMREQLTNCSQLRRLAKDSSAVDCRINYSKTNRVKIVSSKRLKTTGPSTSTRIHSKRSILTIEPRQELLTSQRLRSIKSYRITYIIQTRMPMPVLSERATIIRA